MQKTDDQYLAFHGEWSPFSNFYHSPFTIEGQYYHSAEQWIQSHKALLFGDSYTANLILKADTPLECKTLGYQVNGFDPQRWQTEGYNECLLGIRAKFIQNKPLMDMLKLTQPKIIMESTLDKLWGTGIQLQDKDALNPEKWHNTNWMSTVSHHIAI